ncbi:MAG: chemotaxis protein CheD [Pirellulales bacterium]|nr:chemotaxis protein CheD [Pirellulales bacterium]
MGVSDPDRTRRKVEKAMPFPYCPAVAVEEGETSTCRGAKVTSVQHEATVVRVNMADIAYARAPVVLETLLGSCVGVAIWDRSRQLGALAHVVLPDSHARSGSPGKFADTAIAEAKRRLVLQGAVTRSLTAKIAGGATMFQTTGNLDIGRFNHQAVVTQLRRQGITLTGEHVGGQQGRLIRFSPQDGTVRVIIAREEVAVL